uniref:Uncharacterized protein n=1 Tax=Rangifer tarandus platyrhynchus TaxID=3082113 RepID=A0ACB0DZK8_RANTA|nr:unnamed protein product [Rangifer tarandus platyrhynchus]
MEAIRPRPRVPGKAGGLEALGNPAAPGGSSCGDHRPLPLDPGLADVTFQPKRASITSQQPERVVLSKEAAEASACLDGLSYVPWERSSPDPRKPLAPKCLHLETGQLQTWLVRMKPSWSRQGPDPMILGPRKRDKRRRSPCEFRGRARNDATTGLSSQDTCGLPGPDPVLGGEALAWVPLRGSLGSRGGETRAAHLPLDPTPLPVPAANGPLCQALGTSDQEHLSYYDPLGSPERGWDEMSRTPPSRALFSPRQAPPAALTVPSASP